MKNITVRGPKNTLVIQVNDSLTNSQAASKAAGAVGISGLFSWYPYPRADPERVVNEGQVFDISVVPRID